jgi:hypothetical protein
VVAEIVEKLPKDYNAEQWKGVVLSELYKKVSDAEKINSQIQTHQDMVDQYPGKLEALKDKYSARAAEIEKKYAERQESYCQKILAKVKDLNYVISQKQQKINELKEMIAQLESEIRINENTIDNLVNSEKQANIQSMMNEKKTELDASIEMYKKDEEALKFDHDAAKKFINTNKPVEVEPLRKEAENAETMKNYIREAERTVELNVQINDLIEKSAKLTGKIETARELPGELLQKASMPVPGITIVNGELLVNGLPLDNLSDGEKITIALEIAKAKAGDLKVILLDGFEKLSKNRRDDFIAKAKETGLQYFITRVTDDEGLNIIEI